MPLRIGVHLGEIVQSNTDIYGDGVNVAARLESLGQPGVVLISGEVRKQIKNQDIETVSMGRFSMKNVTTPLDVFAVNAPGLVIPKGNELKGKGKRLSTIKSIFQTSWWVRLAAFGFCSDGSGRYAFLDHYWWAGQAQCLIGRSF